jgi:ubiquinone/menaquinone biosynthesis C-methylase UbiE
VPVNKGFQDYFSASASAYAQHRPTYPQELVDFLVRSCAHPGVAWDCGCGSGQLSVLLANRFQHVLATDPSEQQLANAKQHPRVEYRLGSAEASGLTDRSVDLSVAAQAAHWFDLPAYYAEVRRVTKPGGIVALITYGNMVADEAVLRLLQHFYKDVTGPYWPPGRKHVEEGYRSFAFPFGELPTPQLEIHREWDLPATIGYVETWSATTALRQAKGDAPIEKFRRDLAEAWGSKETVRLIRWPLSIRLGRV